MQQKRQSFFGGTRRASWLTAAVASCAFLLVGNHLYAQAASGTILGTGTDSGGATLPNAQLTIVHPGPQPTYDAVTNESGNFPEPNLPSGTYPVSVAAPGFKKETRENIEVI